VKEAVVRRERARSRVGVLFGDWGLGIWCTRARSCHCKCS